VYFNLRGISLNGMKSILIKKDLYLYLNHVFPWRNLFDSFFFVSSIDYQIVTKSFHLYRKKRTFGTDPENLFHNIIFIIQKRISTVGLEGSCGFHESLHFMFLK
jgi:hypothetical protein